MHGRTKYANPNFVFRVLHLKEVSSVVSAESKVIRNHLCIPNMNQVSSRGCSRAYILCVLFRGLHYVRKLRRKSLPVSFPFPAFEIECWLEKAKEDCSGVEFQRMYGGTDFSPSDVSTFWTSASHFYTW